MILRLCPTYVAPMPRGAAAKSSDSHEQTPAGAWGDTPQRRNETEISTTQHNKQER